MRITVSGRHADVSDSLRTYATEKANKLERYYDRLMSVDVVFDVDAGTHRCEMVARAGHQTTFVAKEENQEPYASLDAAVKDIERQLTRHKEKFRNRKHSTSRHQREPLGDSSPEDLSAGTQPEGEVS